MGAVAKAKRFTMAHARWLAAGMPVRDEARVEAIYTNHCVPCDHFKVTNEAKKLGKCKLCGCNCGATNKWLNKLRWSTEKCPAGYWAAEAEPDPKKLLETIKESRE
jgi:hypothetical protein